MLRKASVRLAILLWAMSLSGVAQKSETPMARCWSYSTAVSVAAGIVVDDANAFFVDGEGRITALDRANGAIAWRSELGGKIGSAIVFGGEAIYVISTVPSVDGRSASDSIRSISRTTGITNWSAELSSSGPHFAKASNGTLVLSGSDGGLVGINTLSGSSKWNRTFQGDAGAELSVNGQTAAIPHSGGGVDIVSIIDGTILKTYRIDGKPVAKVSAVGDKLVFADSSGKITTADGDWKYKTGGTVTHLLPFGGNILAASADNFVYSLSVGSGNVEWKRRMPGRIASLALIGETKAVVTVIGEAAVYVIRLDEGKFVGQLALAQGEELLASTPAGDERFVAVLTTSGVTAFGSGCGKGKSGE